jgi:leucyl aminopeptidase
MEFQFVEGDPVETQADALVLPVPTEGESFALTPDLTRIDSALNGELVNLISDARFTGRPNSTLILATLGLLKPRRIVLTGIGTTADLSGHRFMESIGVATRAARDIGARAVTIALPEPANGLSPLEALEAGAVGAQISNYRFDHYRGSASPNRDRVKSVESVAFVGSGLTESQSADAIRRAQAISRAVWMARDLGNEPASTLTPELFAARAREIAAQSGLEIEILGPGELAELGANAMLAVGGGSSNSPRLIRLRYQPETVPSDSRVPGLVGKAITFDTGGYSIKPYEAMLDMKGDMAGGAAVLGAMSALRALECQTAVVATICAAENMISGDAFRPGDVIEGMNGVTMEILNTDAEGRLVLADGLVDTARRGATELIDLATLTGAAVVALGNGTTALFASDDRLADDLLSAAESTGERMWRMPLVDEFEKKIEGDVADIKNTGGRAGGAITAALFLRHFREGLPWAHLDIAGSSRQEKATPLGPKGATGVGVLTLLHYLLREESLT